MSTVKVNLRVNGTAYARDVEPRMLLCDFLREELELKGTHIGCEHGVCGTCTVLVDGESARACLMFAVQADGAEVRTVESLAKDGKLSLIQQAFWEKHGLQCGFCTPGMILTAKALLDENPNPTEEDVKRALTGNLCRCTGYFNIVDAVQTAVAMIKGGKQ